MSIIMYFQLFSHRLKDSHNPYEDVSTSKSLEKADDGEMEIIKKTSTTLDPFNKASSSSAKSEVYENVAPCHKKPLHPPSTSSDIAADESKSETSKKKTTLLWHKTKQ